MAPAQTANRPGIDAFHRERSRCLDAFVTVEEAIIALLVRSGSKLSGEPFGKKVERLKKATASPSFSEKSRSTVERLLSESTSLIEIRNDVAHSRLQIAKIGEIEKACFINARECANGSQTARLFTLQSLREVTTNAAKLAQALTEA